MFFFTRNIHINSCLQQYSAVPLTHPSSLHLKLVNGAQECCARHTIQDLAKVTQRCVHLQLSKLVLILLVVKLGTTLFKTVCVIETMYIPNDSINFRVFPFLSFFCLFLCFVCLNVCFVHSNFLFKCNRLQSKDNRTDRGDEDR